MQKRFWIPLVVVGALLFLFIFSAKTQAWTQFRTGPSATVGANETVDSSLWVGGRNINIAGTVNGDVFCGGQTINISGTIKGDVICGGQNITISGNVEGSVRLGAMTVNLSGDIGRNATVAAQTINTDSRSRIGADASFGGSDLNLNGTIGRDLAVGGKNVTITGTVKRDVKASADNIVLTNGAKVDGGVEYTSKNSIQISNGAQVSGEVTQHTPKSEPRSFVSLAVFHGVIALTAAFFLLVTALIITALAPQLVHGVSQQAIRRPWWVLLTGFVAGAIVPIIFILLLVTILGIPLAILLLFSWLLIASTSGLFSAYYVGQMVWKSQKNVLLRVLVGGLILLVLFLIPYIGFLVMLATFWMGTGMVLLALKDRYRRPIYHIK